MSTMAQIRSEDYLRMTFEHDAEFVHGEIVERSMPAHSDDVDQSIRCDADQIGAKRRKAFSV